jgi:hypothetical protein
VFINPGGHTTLLIGFVLLIQLPLMKSVRFFLVSIFLLTMSFSCSAQRDVNTSSARAAYSVPSSDSYKSKSKKKKNKHKAKKTRKRNTDASILRKRPLGL